MTTVNGGITLSANESGTRAEDFVGLLARDATIQTTGTGNISLTGTGGDHASTDQHYGVFLKSETSVSSSLTGANAGTITIVGTGGCGTSNNHGIRVQGNSTVVTSVDGAISLTGTGGNIGLGGHGLFMLDFAAISSTGTGPYSATIMLAGSGGNGDGTSSTNHGVLFSGGCLGVITSVDGTISITGQGGTGRGNGIHSSGDNTISSTGTGDYAASITINGTSSAGDTFSSDLGVSLAGLNTIITSVGHGGPRPVARHFGRERQFRVRRQRYIRR